MEKRMFIVLDEMNVNDEVNKTGTVGVCPDLIRAQKTKAGGEVTMGVPESVLMDLVMRRRNIKPILLIVDLDEYKKISEGAEPTNCDKAVELLKELCQLKHYKDTVGKDSFYEKRQPELWKMANDFLNECK